MKSKQCEVCSAWLASNTAIAEHEKGKRHQKALAQRAGREELGKRSVFLSGFPAHSLTEQSISAHFARHFGPVERVLLGPKGTTAILEFDSTDPVQLALKLGKVKIDDNVVAQIKPRELKFESAGGVAEAEEDLDGLKALIADIIQSEGSAEEHVAKIVETLEMEDLTERTKAMQKLQVELAPYLPAESRIGVHGSCVSGLGLKGCDLDASLFYPQPQSVAEGGNSYLRSRSFLLNTEPGEMRDAKAVTSEEVESLSPIDRVRFLCRLINHLRKTGRVEVTRLMPVLSRRCPTVSLVWERRYTVDLSINNHHALRNAQWLGSLANALPLYRQLTFLLRFWGKTTGVVGGEQRVTSYAFGLAILTYLRSAGTVELDDTADNPVQVMSKKTHEVLGDLMTWLSGLEWKQTVLSPKRGAVVQLPEWKLSTDFHADFKLSLMNIQDPFDLAHNTAGQTAVKQSQRFWQELKKASGRLNRHPDTPLRALFNLFPDLPRSSGVRTPGSDSDETCLFLDGSGLGLGSDRGEVVRAALGRLLTEVLDFSLPENSEGTPMDCDREPGAKRAKVESNGGSCGEELRFHIYWRSWQGRRLKRRAVSRDHPKLSPIQIEKEDGEEACVRRMSGALKVSGELKKTGMISSSPVVVLGVEVGQLGEVDVAIRFHHRGPQPPTQPPTKSPDFANLAHFLKLFVPNYVHAFL